MVRLVNQRWRWCGQKSFQKNKKSRTFRSALNDPSGNRTRVYGVRGRRLDRLTNGPGKSRRQDSNLRPLRPERSALPN